MPPAKPVLVWFRRDLRLSDHGALAAAGPAPVVPVFVREPRLWDGAGARRQQRLAASLAALDADIRSAGGAGLVVRTGDPALVLAALAGECRADEVLVSGDYAPYGVRRDRRVAAALAGVGVRLRACDSPYLAPPGTVRKPDGTSYAVFTPFHRAWQRVAAPAPIEARELRFHGHVAGESVPGPQQGAGTAAALARLDEFAEAGWARYAGDRDRPDLPGTSRLSVALHFGELHPRTIAARFPHDEPGFLRQLCWRDFYADVLYHRPQAAHANLDTRFDRLRWDTGPLADAQFAAWTAGRTGYPFVDAGMRQLAATGWMHNRARMVAASFLTKDLFVDWRRGAAWFLRHLLDGDVANNALGWQWVAGTGTDAAPYFRVFNPVAQGLRFDPDGAYVRRWVPELRGLPGPAAHEPWRHGAPGYAERMVDHAEARAEALRRYAELR